MESYRCKGCGYFHIGPAPEQCPVCGAPRSFFVEYEGPGDLGGSKTLENLKAAFAGESQANRRYTLFMRIAELEGFDAAREAFERALTEETAHALVEPYAPIYARCPRACAETAEEEGYPQIAQYFRALGGYERQHRDAFRKVLDDLG